MAQSKGDKPLHADHRARMQERVRREGLGSLAAHEVLEYLLFFSIPRKDTNALAHRLIQHFGSYCNVLDASEEELLKVEGIGPASARLIASIRSFDQYYLLQQRRGRPHPLSNEAARIEYVRPLFYSEHNEICYLIAMNDQYMPLRDIRVSEGVPNHVAINTRKMAREAVASGCTCAFLAHNHPTGLAAPSSADIYATRLANQALAPLGIHLVDHIIVAPGDAASMMKQFAAAAAFQAEPALASEPAPAKNAVAVPPEETIPTDTP